MPSAIMAFITASLPALQQELHRRTIHYREEHQSLERRLRLYRKLRDGILAGRLDEGADGAEALREAENDIRDRLASLDRMRDRNRTLRAQIEVCSDELDEATTEGPLTPEQARKRAERDQGRRRRISDLQAAKNDQVAAKNRQIAAVRSKLGRWPHNAVLYLLISGSRSHRFLNSAASSTVGKAMNAP